MTKDEIIEYTKRLNDNTSKILNIGGFSPTLALEIAHDISIVEQLRSKDVQFSSLSNGRWANFSDKPTTVDNLNRLKNDLETAISILEAFNLRDIEELTAYLIRDGYIEFHAKDGVIESIPSKSMENSLEIIDSINHLRNSLGMLPMKNIWKTPGDEIGQ